MARGRDGAGCGVGSAAPGPGVGGGQARQGPGPLGRRGARGAHDTGHPSDGSEIKPNRTGETQEQGNILAPFTPV